MNADYEMGLAQAAISNAISAATALESAANRIDRGDRCEVLAGADRWQLEEITVVVEKALAKLRKAASPSRRAA